MTTAYLKNIKYALAITSASLLISACTLDKNANHKAKQDSALDAFANEQVLTTLVDFDDSNEQGWLSNAGTTSKQVADAGNQKLAVNFLSSHNQAKLQIKPESPWNFAQYQHYNLAFDVQNTSDESAHVYLALTNPKGELQSRSISLPASFNGTVYFPLHGQESDTETGLWGDAPPWKTDDQLMVWRSWRDDRIDLSSVESLTFFTIGNLSDKSITLDNIRLRKNPESDPNWMVAVVDKYGQNAKKDVALNVSSDAELKAAAEQELAALAKSTGMPDRSKFGGYTKGPKLKATGYFRTEKVDGKWWMVDPEGYVFFSHGPANVRMANMTTITGVDFHDASIRVRHSDEVTPEDSMGIVKIPDAARETRYIASELRHNMFQWLPSYDDPLAEHYSYRRSTHKGALPHGETYSFYRANLERRYGETSPLSYVKKWHEVTMQRMKDWGFTSFGNWVDPAFYQADQVPYFANGWIIGDFKTLSGHTNHWGLMPDPYDPVFSERAKATIDVIAKNIQSSPWCVGIFIDNEKSWGEREGTVEQRYGVILDALSKPSQQSPAKAAFAKHLKSKYRTIEALNNAWQTDINNWHSFNNGVTFERYNNAHIKDISDMLKMLGEQYFTVVHNTLEAALPNHLYMGARMANWGMPDEIIEASVTYSDVLSFNIYEEGVQDHYWQFLEEVDLPVTIGEFHIGTATDSGLYNPGIVHAANQTDRANMYKTYMESVINKPYMVGAHWFQYIDEPISGRSFDGENANIGFVTVADIPYPELISAVKEVTSTMYQKRLAK
ncbi:agarase [Thalassotalea sp. PLHSN55]|uniref:agarase n=1 Tax=Thalassotalea sp. PLHSN55 TaxID=3435888 RepID=UPI003F8268BA